LQGLLRRYAGQNLQEPPRAAGGAPPSFDGPVIAQFRRQKGQDITSASIHSSRLHPLHAQHELTGAPIKPKTPVELLVTFASQRRGPEVQVVSDEIMEVASIALASAFNPYHRNTLEFQSRARICRRWLLLPEAMLRFQRLQLGRLSEPEILELEPRIEPEFANRGVITAVLTLVNNDLPMASISLWKKARIHLGAPLFQKVVDFDPTAGTVSKESVRDAIKYYTQTWPYKAEMCAAAAALHDWLGAVFWVRKEMRAVTSVVQNTNLPGVCGVIESGDVPLVRNILEVDKFHGDGADEDGNTLLHAVAIKGEGDETLAKLVLSTKAADSMLNQGDKAGMTPLHHAVEKKQPGMTRVLRQSGADVDVVDATGRTPLHHAVTAQDLGLISQLLEANANPNIMANNNETAMDLAAGWEDAREMLQGFGAMTGGGLMIQKSKAAQVDQASEEQAEENVEGEEEAEA